ncbi:MAG: hypothetical protein R3D30_12465 [Hyphomicrobiales bacterium]
MEQGGRRAAAAVGQTMGEQQTQAVGNLPAAVEEGAQPDPASMNGGEVVALAPEQPGPPLEGVSAAPVVPPPSTDAAIDTSENRARADSLAAENKITKEQLERGNEPEFEATLGAREDAEKHDQEAPQKLREAESQDRQSTRERAEGAVTGGLAAFQGERAERLNAVAGRQTATRGVTEARKQEITADIAAIGASVRADVTAILEAMDTEASGAFERAINEALTAYDAAFEDVKGGIGTSISDFFSGTSSDERLDMAFAAGRRVFDARISRGITEVARIVEKKLAEARDRVARGRAEIDRYMTEEISSAERDIAAEASTAITADFDALESEIDSRRDSLVERMVGMYREGMERRNAREEELREENKSFWDRVYDATVGVIQKVIEFKNMLLGMLARAAAVVEAIIQDPIGFLRNLIAGIRAGLDSFVGNIVEHLKQGLMGWLFGALQGAGIEIPERFDLKGILSLVFQVLGLTYANIRTRAVRLLGEEMVTRLEQAAEIFRVLVTEGPAGLWRMLLEKLGDIKETILGQIRDFVITRIIKAGIMWLIGLLNPASAFVKACMMIYDIVSFFIERGQQIIEFVNSIINSLGAIVAGNISGMARAIESTLARILPIAISFLAALLGLGGISAKIRQIIETIQRPVNRAIDWVIGKAVAVARRAGDMFSGRRRGRDEGEPEDPEKQLRIDAALEDLHRAERAQADEGGVTLEEAEVLAQKVRADHPVISGIRVVPHGDRWRYFYRASAQKSEDGEQQAVTRITDEWFRENRLEIFRKIHDLAWQRYRGPSRRAQPNIVEQVAALKPGETLDIDGSGHQRRARGQGGKGNVVFGVRRGEAGVAGETYGELGSRLAESDIDTPAVAAGVTAGVRGEQVESEDVYDLAMILLPAETSRSRGTDRRGGMSEVTGRLAQAAWAKEQLGIEETIGSREAQERLSAARRAQRESNRETQERRQSREITGPQARAAQAEAARPMRSAQRQTGGLLPESMPGFANARRAAVRLTDPKARDPRGETRVDAEELINRLAEFVYRSVSSKEGGYSSMDELMREINNTLDSVDDKFMGSD